MTDAHNQIIEDADAGKELILQKLVDRVKKGETLSAAEIKRYEDLLEYFKRKQSGDEIVKTTSAAARYCGMGERKIRYYLKESKHFKIRQNSDGAFDKAELDRFLNYMGGRGPAEKKTGKDSKDADTRYREAKAQEKELLVARMRAELIAVDDVKRLFTDRAHEMAKSLQLLARRVSVRIAGKSKKPYQEVFEIIESEVNAILGTYSRPVESLRDSKPTKRTR